MRKSIIANEPTLISINEVRESSGSLVVAIREFPLDIGSIDILGFTANGEIAAIECKLAKSEEIKRRVIGQVFEYGANLWGMSYDALDQKVIYKTKKSLAELVRSSVELPDWDEESFRRSISSNLAEGNLILIIVVDEINEELGRIVRFINFAGNPAFSLSALELRRFQHNEIDMLVPHVFGVIEKTRQGLGYGDRKRWDEESFFKDAKERLKASTTDLIRNLYKWSNENADVMRFGTGWASGSFTFCLKRDDKTGSLFSIYSNGVLTLNYGYMKKIFSADQVREFSLNISSMYFPVESGQ